MAYRHDLNVQIRVALSFLGRPADMTLSRLSLEELRAMRNDLHAEVQEANLRRTFACCGL